MTNDVYTPIHCAVCGRTMGKKPGVQVVLDAICDDPICNYQPAPTAMTQRDGFIVAAAMDGGRISEIARHNQVSRQRVYQIVGDWMGGI